jgi:hypothetical protein
MVYFAPYAVLHDPVGDFRFPHIQGISLGSYPVLEYAMADLTIPDPIIQGLETTARLSDESFRELVSALEGVPLKIRSNRIFDDSNFELKTVSEVDKRLIRDALMPLYLARLNTNVPVSTFTDDVLQALERKTDGTSAESISKLGERLRELLSIEKLNLITKAHDVLTEHSQTYGKARIISDIRPVFGEDIQEGAAAAVIVHMLNIVYYQAGKRNDFVVALDSKDVEQLMETLKRAEEKAKLLESFIRSTNTPYIEIA